MRDNDQEIFPIVDCLGNIVGKSTRRHCHDGSMLLHPVVHLHVFNKKGELYLQLRPHWKDIQPDRWDTAVGGHIDFGENVEHALRRETKEELGITKFKAVQSDIYVFESMRERELVYQHYTFYNGAITPSDETAGGKFWQLNEINNQLGHGIFTPNFENEFLRLLNNAVLVQKLRTKVGDLP